MKPVIYIAFAALALHRAVKKMLTVRREYIETRVRCAKYVAVRVDLVGHDSGGYYPLRNKTVYISVLSKSNETAVAVDDRVASRVEMFVQRIYRDHFSTHGYFVIDPHIDILVCAEGTKKMSVLREIIQCWKERAFDHESYARLHPKYRRRIEYAQKVFDDFYPASTLRWQL